MERAEELAEPWGIPIQIGDSEQTDLLEFDRDMTQILQIPTKQYLYLERYSLRVNTTLMVTYKDEFRGAENIWVETLLVSNLPHRGEVRERIWPQPGANPYQKSFRFRPKYIGEYEVRVCDSDGPIANDRCKVER
jgi:hypothetical protein|tara:strand:+ start:467 stop:871 length:405 start_codon:yes stop_codon:yes gene_type:complete